jgi:hypothetical protein
MMMHSSQLLGSSAAASACWYLLVLCSFFFLLPTTTSAEPTLLVGNTRGGSEIFQYGLDSGMVSEWIIPNILESPDHIVAYQGQYYISTGTEVNTSSIARMTNVENDDTAPIMMELDFATGGGLKRPYGFDFYQDILYVASFMTDQILMYNATTGDYMGVMQWTQSNRYS